MFKTKPVSSEIIIDAPPKDVFAVIIDFDRYGEWNRFTPRITLNTNSAVEGTEFDLDCQMTETQLLRDEHEVILELNPDAFTLVMGTSRTKGRPGIKSYRRQICHPVDSNTTRFINSEEFHGPLAPLVYFLFAKKLQKAFKNYCEDLKRRVEGLI